MDLSTLSHQPTTLAALDEPSSERCLDCETELVFTGERDKHGVETLVCPACGHAFNFIPPPELP